MTLNGERFAMLGEKRLHDRHVLHVDVSGNCCWSIFKKSYFRGENQMLGLGYSDRPTFDIMSVKKLSCID